MNTPPWLYSIMLGAVSGSLIVGSVVHGLGALYFGVLLFSVGVASGLAWAHSAILSMQHALAVGAAGLQSTFQQRSNYWNYVAALLTAALAAIQVAAIQST